MQPLCTHVDKLVTSNFQICFPAPYLSLHTKYSHMPNMPRGRTSPVSPTECISAPYFTHVPAQISNSRDSCVVYSTYLLPYVWLKDRSSQSRRNICFVSFCKTLHLYCVIFTFPLLVFKWTFTFEMSFIATWTDPFKPRQHTRCLGGPTSTPSNNVVC